jgi:hypothetical protein
VRIGIHTGPAVAGLVGKRRFTYDIWGDSVNVAQRLEAAADPGRINISASTYHYVNKFFDIEPCGAVEPRISPRLRCFTSTASSANSPRTRRACSRPRLHRSRPHRHSITSSARASSGSGTVSPSALAVLRLITSSNLFGACTGSSLGFSPSRMRSMYDAACRNCAIVSMP